MVSRKCMQVNPEKKSIFGPFINLWYNFRAEIKWLYLTSMLWVYTLMARLIFHSIFLLFARKQQCNLIHLQEFLISYTMNQEKIIIIIDCRTLLILWNAPAPYFLCYPLPKTCHFHRNQQSLAPTPTPSPTQLQIKQMIVDSSQTKALLFGDYLFVFARWLKQTVVSKYSTGVWGIRFWTRVVQKSFRKSIKKMSSVR